MLGKTRHKQPNTVLDLKSISRPSQRRFHRWMWLLPLVIIAGVILLFVVIQFSTKTSNGLSAQKQAIAKVGKLMFLPTGEDPTYGTVLDKNKLNQQIFFAHAENGDEVLIYQKALLSILYRPSVNKIVNVGPLVVGSQPSPYITSKIAIADGSGNPEALAAMAKKVAAAFPNAQIVSQGPASRSYPVTIAIDLTKKNQPLDEQVADSLGIKAGQAPLGEPLPNGDILIIIGTDYK